MTFSAPGDSAAEPMLPASRQAPLPVSMAHRQESVAQTFSSVVTIIAVLGFFLLLSSRALVSNHVMSESMRDVLTVFGAMVVMPLVMAATLGLASRQRRPPLVKLKEDDGGTFSSSSLLALATKRNLAFWALAMGLMLGLVGIFTVKGLPDILANKSKLVLNLRGGMPYGTSSAGTQLLASPWGDLSACTHRNASTPGHQNFVLLYSQHSRNAALEARIASHPDALFSTLDVYTQDQDQGAANLAAHKHLMQLAQVMFTAPRTAAEWPAWRMDLLALSMAVDPMGQHVQVHGDSIPCVISAAAVGFKLPVELLSPPVLAELRPLFSKFNVSIVAVQHQNVIHEALAIHRRSRALPQRRSLMTPLAPDSSSAAASNNGRDGDAGDGSDNAGGNGGVGGMQVPGGAAAVPLPEATGTPVLDLHNFDRLVLSLARQQNDLDRAIEALGRPAFMVPGMEDPLAALFAGSTPSAASAAAEQSRINQVLEFLGLDVAPPRAAADGAADQAGAARDAIPPNGDIPSTNLCALVPNQQQLCAYYSGVAPFATMLAADLCSDDCQQQFPTPRLTVVQTARLWTLGCEAAKQASVPGVTALCDSSAISAPESATKLTNQSATGPAGGTAASTGVANAAAGVTIAVAGVPARAYAPASTSTPATDAILTTTKSATSAASNPVIRLPVPSVSSSSADTASAATPARVATDRLTSYPGASKALREGVRLGAGRRMGAGLGPNAGVGGKGKLGQAEAGAEPGAGAGAGAGAAADVQVEVETSQEMPSKRKAPRRVQVANVAPRAEELGAPVATQEAPKKGAEVLGAATTQPPPPQVAQLESQAAGVEGAFPEVPAGPSVPAVIKWARNQRGGRAGGQRGSLVSSGNAPAGRLPGVVNPHGPRVEGGGSVAVEEMVPVAPSGVSQQPGGVAGKPARVAREGEQPTVALPTVVPTAVVPPAFVPPVVGSSSMRASQGLGSTGADATVAIAAGDEEDEDGDAAWEAYMGFYVMDDDMSEGGSTEENGEVADPGEEENGEVADPGEGGVADVEEEGEEGDVEDEGQAADLTGEEPTAEEVLGEGEEGEARGLDGDGQVEEGDVSLYAEDAGTIADDGYDVVGPTDGSGYEGFEFWDGGDNRVENEAGSVSKAA
eukprot:jgi/Mesvir1/10895/Mv11173-RA.2